MNVDMADYSETLVDLSGNETVRRHTPDDCSYALVQSSIVSLNNNRFDSTIGSVMVTYFRLIEQRRSCFNSISN